MFGNPGKVGLQSAGGAGKNASVDLNFMGGTLDSRFTFARASTATDGLYTDVPGSSYNTYATGVPRAIAGKGLLVEQGTTNRLLNTDTPATQTTPSLATGSWCLWVIGTGSAAVTAGTATLTGNGTATAGVPNVFSVTVAGTVTVTVTGSLTRFQLENLGFPTSYVPSSGSAGVRASETLSMPTAAWYNATAGTLYAEVVELTAATTNATFLELNDGTINNRVSLQGNSTQNPFSSMTNAGTSTLNNGTNTFITTAPQRFAVSYGATGHTVALDGTAHTKQAAPAGGVPTMNALWLGMHTNGTGYANCIIRRAKYYPRELSSAELAQITLMGTDDSSLDFNFMGGTLDSRLTYSHANPGTFVNSSGYIQAATANVPRFDYDPVTLLLRGLLIEQGTTNVANNSGTLTGTNWNNSGSAIASSAVVSPDGSSTGMLVTEDSSTTTDHARDFTFTATGSSSYTGSVFVRPGTRTKVAVELRVAGNWVGGNAIAVADLVAGTIALTSGTATFGIQPRFDGWFRIFIQATAAASPVGTSLFRLGLCDASGNNVYNGDGASGAYFWGAQLEATNIMTSYVPTVGSAVGRSGDTLTMPVGPWYTSAAGTLFAEGESKVYFTTLNTARIDDGTANNFIGLHFGNARNPWGTITNAGTPATAQLVSPTLTLGTVYRQAMTYSASGLTASFGGATTSPAHTNLPSGGVPTVTTLRLGMTNTGTFAINGALRRLRYWQRELATSELINITT